MVVGQSFLLGKQAWQNSVPKSAELQLDQISGVLVFLQFVGCAIYTQSFTFCFMRIGELQCMSLHMLQFLRFLVTQDNLLLKRYLSLSNRTIFFNTASLEPSSLAIQSFRFCIFRFKVPQLQDKNPANFVPRNSPNLPSFARSLIRDVTRLTLAACLNLWPVHTRGFPFSFTIQNVLLCTKLNSTIEQNGTFRLSHCTHRSLLRVPLQCPLHIMPH